jgi:hypothetical protein
VFNLSSWAEKRQPIAEWLVDELNVKYNIPKKIARPWVEHDELLLLLDGLDEVQSELREACVKAINDFRQEHGLTPLVVCSRIADYEALTTRLKLQGAVLLQSLTPEQIDQYLEGAGTELLAVRRTLQHDTTLQELAQSPLMLSIMTLAYRGTSVQDLQSLDTTEARRSHVLDAYVQRMFERRGGDKRFSPEQTIRWLAWLAQKMSQCGQTMFLIERMQPSWLDAGNRRLYTLFLDLMTVPIMVTGGMLVGVLGGTMVFGKLTFGLRAGPIVGLVFALISLVKLAIDILSNTAPESIKPVEELKWSWKEGRKELIDVLRFGLIGGLIIALIAALAVVGGSKLAVEPTGSAVADAEGLMINVLAGVVFFIGLFGLVALEGGLSYAETKTRVVPNQGIRQSVRNAAIVCLITVLILGLGVGLSMLILGLHAESRAEVAIWLSITLIFVIVGLVFGLPAGLMMGSAFGGRAVIRHFTLRFIFYCNGRIPWNYARFLDYAAERIFLRKVGGGYIFVHRLLLEHFAAKSAEGVS